LCVIDKLSLIARVFADTHVVRYGYV